MLSGLSVGAAMLVFFVVPEKRLPGQGATLRSQLAGFGTVFSSLAFWRIALALVVCHACYLSMQGLWLGPWLYDVGGQARPTVANYLFLTALAYTVGSVFWGAIGTAAPMTTFKIGLVLSVAMFALLAAGVRTGLGAILAVYGFCAISAALAYAVLTPLFPPEMTGRLNTASNVLMFGFSFAFQWGIGAVLRLYPVSDARYSPEGYAMALWILVALQAATSPGYYLCVSRACKRSSCCRLRRCRRLCLRRTCRLDHFERELVDAVFLDLGLDLFLQLRAVLPLSQSRSGNDQPCYQCRSDQSDHDFPLVWFRPSRAAEHRMTPFRGLCKTGIKPAFVRCYSIQ